MIVNQSEVKCHNCTGLENCNKYCKLRAGTNLVKFIQGLDIIETRIGELEQGYKTTKKTLIISGQIIEEQGCPTYILSGLNTIIDASGKFKSFDNTSPVQLLKCYLESQDISEKIKENTIDAFKKINSNQCLSTPLKPGTPCEILGDNNKVYDSKIVRVKWESDIKTGKIKCSVLCYSDKQNSDDTRKLIQIPLEKYGEFLRLPKVEKALTSSELDRSMIKMTSTGFIEPIQISDGSTTLALDGQYLYRIIEDKVIIIGTWGIKKFTSFQKGIESLPKGCKAYKKIVNAYNYIDKHKRFIAPFKLFSINFLKI